VVLTASAMSQPFADISVTNSGTAACLLRGYARITAWGHVGGGARATRLGILVHHGIYERADRGPRRVTLEPGEAGYLSVGTATAFQGGRHPIAVTRLSVTLPDDAVARPLVIDLLASRQPGGRIPVGITAMRPAPRE
jgi:Protein of unknown function (DUF4232)